MDESPDESPDGGGDPIFDEEIVREIYHSVNDAIFVHNAETGEILDVNETMCEMYGYTRQEARDLTVEALSSGRPPYTQERAIEYVERAAEGEPQVFDWEAKDSEGNLFWVEVSMRRARLEDDTLVLVIVRDITERKEYERRLKDQRDNLETLTEMVLHDIRNDLQLVQAHSEIVEEYVADEGREHISTVQESAANAVELTRTAHELVEVMLQTDTENQQVSLVRVLRGPLEEVRAEHPEAVVTVSGSFPRVDVVGNEMLGSLFRNLLENAVRHNDREVPEITVEATARDGRVEVRIADNGPGVPATQREAIFQKGEKGLESPGTGIGLYLVKTLVETSGGDVWVEDNDPRGSIFVVELPTAT